MKQLLWITVLGATLSAAPGWSADLELANGVLSYTAAPATVANQLAIGLAGATYTIADPAEAIVVGPAALAAGCEAVDANAVTCPAAAIASFSIATRFGDDLVDCSGATHPCLVVAGDGDDTVIGGEAADVVVWNPGDDDDDVDGGPGADTLEFNGANIAEHLTVTPDGAGFRLTRDVAAVVMTVVGTETLVLRTVGGADVVTTAPLADTAQIISSTDDAAVDTLTLDAGGLCPFFGADTIEVVDREPIAFSGFDSVFPVNDACGAIVDVVAGVLRYTGTQKTPAAANLLTVTRAGADYVVHDDGEPIDRTPNAAALGCVATAADTVRCPQVLVASFEVLTRNGDDTIDLSDVAAPAAVFGGDGDDTIIGGSGDDTVVWTPGDDDDVIDGGPGADTLDFVGAPVAERFTVTQVGEGFRLARDVANVTMEADDVETLRLRVFGGSDVVTTTPLARTAQFLTGGTDVDDALVVDARGLCAEQQEGVIATPGRPLIQFAHFPTVALNDVFCIADPCEGASATFGCTVNGVRNQLCLGTDGDDVIVGSKNGDVILGGGGNDRIRAGLGDDLVCGEAGDDLLIGARGRDTLVGGPGNDRLRGDADDDTLVGGDDADDLRGGSGADNLYAGLGDDRLRAGAGEDTLRGDDGDDLVDGGSAEDTCFDSDQDGPFARCELP